MISFSGIVTFNSAKSIQETAQKIPLKNILIETDCPYLSPVPERGTENYPNKVKYVLKKIQELR
jgi:TatD DNase family protein